jgi:hypothetical protein
MRGKVGRTIKRGMEGRGRIVLTCVRLETHHFLLILQRQHWVKLLIAESDKC